MNSDPQRASLAAEYAWRREVVLAAARGHPLPMRESNPPVQSMPETLTHGLVVIEDCYMDADAIHAFYAAAGGRSVQQIEDSIGHRLYKSGGFLMIQALQGAARRPYGADAPSAS